MAGSSEDWPQVLERLLAGDRLAFLRINRLVTAVLVKLGAYDFRDEWDDLRQEVVLALVANAGAGRLREPEKLLAYVRIITRNKFFDRLGQQERRREKHTVPWGEDSESSSAQRADGGNDVDERLADVWREAHDLPAQQRQVLEGVYRQGKTYQEVADETGIPLGTVKRRLRESLLILRRRLGGATEKD